MSAMYGPLIDPRITEVVVELGRWLQRYLVLSTLFEMRNVVFNDDKWNALVRRETKRVNDPALDLETAFSLMDEQNNCCKRCLSYFTVDSEPSLSKSIRHHTFLGMRSTETKYSWICENCTGDRLLEDRIERMIEEEEELELQ